MLRSRSLHVVLWFIFVGPLVGAVLYLPEKALLNGTFTLEVLKAGIYVFLSPIAFVGAYALLIVPSVLTGVLAAFAAKRLPAPIFIAATTVFGGLAFSAYVEAFGRVPAWTVYTSSVLGVSVAACCALLAVWTASND